MNTRTAITSGFRQAIAALTCLAIVVWSLAPVSPHVPQMLQTLQEHAEMVADHGHSHGQEEDLIWALHGHAHDVADHDHTQAFLIPNTQTGLVAPLTKSRRHLAALGGPTRHFPIERPPRA